MESIGNKTVGEEEEIGLELEGVIGDGEEVDDVFVGLGEGEEVNREEDEETRYVKRKRCHSLDSPEKVRAGFGGGIGEASGEGYIWDMHREVFQEMEEMKNYAGVTLYRKDNKHEKFLGKRLDKIMTVVEKMAQELVKLDRYTKLAEKHIRMEKEVKKLLTVDLDTVMKDRTVEVAKEVAKIMGEAALKGSQVVQDRIREDFDSWIKASDSMDEQRNRDFVALENKYQEKFNGLNKKVAEMEAAMKSMSSFMENVRVSMDVVNSNVCRLGEVMDGVPWTGIQEMGVKLDVLKTVDVGSMKGEMEKVVEEVGKVVNKLKVAKDGEEDMEVDLPFSEVVRKGRGRKRGPQVIIKTPKVDEKATKGKETVQECLGKKDGEVRVRNMRRYGEDIVMEVHDEGDVEKLKMNEKLKEEGFEVNGEPNMRKPRVVIYGVDRDIKKEELLDAVVSRNPGLFSDWSTGEYKDVFVPEFMTGSRRNFSVAWVVRVEGKIFKKMSEAKRVYIGLYSCRVEEYMEPTRCYKCLSYGHIAIRCRNRIACSRCGEEGHKSEECRSRELRCINCKKADLREQGHSVFWRECPVAGRARRMVERATEYGN